MAVITVGTGGDQTTLNAAIAAATSGDEIRVIAGFSHDGTTVNVNKDNLTFTKADGVTAAVSTSNEKTIEFGSNQTGISFTGYLFINTHASGNRYAIYMNYAQVTFTECAMSMETGSSSLTPIVWLIGDGSLFYRCAFFGNSNKQYGLINPGSGTFTVDSCLILNVGKYGIYTYGSGGAFVRNCTVYTPTQGSGTSYGIYLNTANSGVYNTIVFGSSDMNYGVRTKNDSSVQVKNVISYGTMVNPYLVTGATTANLYDQTDVTADGNPVLVDPAGGDFHPDTSGIAFEGGDPNFDPAKDYDGNDWGNPPSIGALEAESSGGGGGGGAVSPSKAGFLSSPFTLNP
jgi:hypothetical protein